MNKKAIRKGSRDFFKTSDCQDFKELPCFSTLKESNILQQKAEN